MEITHTQIAKIHALLDKGLVKGLGSPEPGKMCVEAAINYALGRPHGDDPGCVIEPLRRLKIRLNDSRYWTSNKARAEGLRRLAIVQLGSKDTVDPIDFAKRVSTMTIQTIVPFALRNAAKKARGKHKTTLSDIANDCEQSPTIDNARDAAAAADAAAYAAHAYAAYAAADAAAEAAADAAAADAAADAAYAAAAYAAYAYAAYAAAYAAYAAAYAADAAAAAAAAADAEKVLIDFAERVVQILIEMKAPGVQWL